MTQTLKCHCRTDFRGDGTFLFKDANYAKRVKTKRNVFGGVDPIFCSVVLVAIVFALRLVSPPAIDRGSIIDGSRRTFLSAAGLLVPKFLFPLPVSRRSKLLQDFFPAVALPSV